MSLQAFISDIERRTGNIYNHKKGGAVISPISGGNTTTSYLSRDELVSAIQSRLDSTIGEIKNIAMQNNMAWTDDSDAYASLLKNKALQNIKQMVDRDMRNAQANGVTQNQHKIDAQISKYLKHLNIFNLKEISLGTNIKPNTKRAYTRATVHPTQQAELQTRQFIEHIMSELGTSQGGYDASAFGGDEHMNGGALGDKTAQLADRLLEHRKKITSHINEFIQKLSGDIDSIATATEHMGTEMGSKIQANSDLLDFIAAFEKFKTFFSRDDLRTKLYQHLLELNIDSVDSRQIKNDFIDIIRNITNKANAIGNSEGINKLNSAFKSLISHIDSATDGLKNVQETIKKHGGASELDTINELFSQSASRVNISAVLNATKKLEIASKKLTFFKDISIFRTNLKSTSSELVKYSESYPQLVGKTIGDAVNRLKTEYNELLSQIDDNKSGLGLEINLYNDTAEIKKKISKEDLKFMYQWQCDARIGLYKTIEAIDLYLYHFTDAVAKNPDAVADLHKMLTATKIIAKWYDVESGKNLIKVFESFADNADEDGVAYVKDIQNDFDAKYKTTPAGAEHALADLTKRVTPTQAKQIFQQTKAAVEGITVLKNIISYFVHLGEKYGDKNSEKHIYMSPNVIYKNLVNYVWSSAFSINVTGTQIMDNDNKVKRLLTIKDTHIGLAQANKAADPEKVGMQSNHLDLLKVKIMRSQNEVNNFKNQFTAFDARGARALHTLLMSMYSKFKDNKEYFTAIARLGFHPPKNYFANLEAGTNNLQDESKIRGTEVTYKDIVDVYQLTRDLSGAENRLDLVDIDTLLIVDENGKPTNKILSKMAFNQHNQTYGVGNDVVQPQGIMARAHFLLDIVMTDLWNKYTTKNSDNPFILDDTYFVMLMKSIVGKIIAVAGINRIFKDPKSFTNTIITNPTRLITGGLVESEEVIADAGELYVRLPLLVEFYYRIFDNGNKSVKTNDVGQDGDNEQISFVPEVGSVWSKLIMIIFEKAKYIDTGIYTKDNISKIISEVNLIYKHYKSSTNKSGEELTRHVVMELIAEVNRRYGVIKRQQLVNYYNVIEDTKRNTFSGDFSEIISSTNDYDILDEANEFEKDSPADKYIELKKTLDSKSTTKDEKISKLTEYMIVKNFRTNIENIFNKTSLAVLNGKTTPVSLRTSIRELKKDLGTISDKTQQYDLIINAIEQVQNVNQTQIDAYLMFHETVLAPLTLLQEVRFNIKKFMLKIFTVCKKWEAKLPQALKDAKIQNDTVINLITAVVNDANYASLVAQYAKYATNDTHHLFVEALIGLSNSFGMLVKLNITSTDNIVLDVSELQNKIELTLASVKSMLSKFVGVVDDELIAKVNGKVTDDGSIYNLEKTILSEMFNKNLHKSSTATVMSFDAIMRILPYMTKAFYETEWSFTQMKENLILPKSTYVYKASDNSQSQLLYKRISLASDQYNKYFDKSQLLKDVFTIYNANAKTFMGLNANAQQNLTLYSYLFNIRGDKIDNVAYSTIVQEFNTLVYQYLIQTYDNSSKKFYSKLVDNFVSSGFPDAINNGYSYPDITSKTDEMSDIIPFNNSPLSSILSYTINTLINRIHPISNMHVFKLSELSEVSPSAFENIKVKLPIFSRIFKLFIEKCKVYRRLLIRVNGKADADINIAESTGVIVKTSVFTQNTGDKADADVVNSGLDYMNYGKINGVSVSKDDAISGVVLILDSIINGMRTLVADADSVISEIKSVDNTPPFMFDVRKDFSKNFMSNGEKELPFGPFSTMTASIRRKNRDALLPIKSNANAKYLYAMRAPIMSKTVSLDDMPYMKELVQRYNNFSQTVNGIEPKKFNDLLSNFMSLYHTVVDDRFFFGSIDKFQIGKTPIASTIVNTDKPSWYRSIAINKLVGKIDAVKNAADNDAVLNDVKAKITEVLTSLRVDPDGPGLVANEIANLVNRLDKPTLNAIARNIDNSIGDDDAAGNADVAKLKDIYKSVKDNLANALIDVIAPVANDGTISPEFSAFADKLLNIKDPIDNDTTAFISIPDSEVDVLAPITGKLRTYQSTVDLSKTIMLLEGYNILQNKKVVFNYLKSDAGAAPRDVSIETIIAQKNKPGNDQEFNQAVTEYERDVAIAADDDARKALEVVLRAAYAKWIGVDVNTRFNAIVANIIDLNVVPINIHSLMREIPLVNLYNYSLTYENAVADIMKDGIVNAGVKDSITTLLKSPYDTDVDLSAVLGKDENKNLGVLSDVLTKYVSPIGDAAAKKLRLNSKLVRNIVFFTLLQRVIRTKVRKEIEFVNTRIISNTNVVSASMDEAMLTEDMNNRSDITFDF